MHQHFAEKVVTGSEILSEVEAEGAVAPEKENVSD
jgi:hypothetical protein